MIKCISFGLRGVTILLTVDKGGDAWLLIFVNPVGRDVLLNNPDTGGLDQHRVKMHGCQARKEQLLS